MKPGYKQTEVGVIPEDWAVKPFSDLYSEPSRNGIYKSAEYQGRGARIVNMGEMFGFEFISNQEMSRISLTPKEIATMGLLDGDLLFGRRSVVPAGAGKCSIVVNPPEPLTFESSIIRVRLEQSKSNPLFYYYFFASPVGRIVMGVIISGTNVKGIRGSELRELKVPYPKLNEQRAVAAALSDVDALLDGLDRLIAKKRDLKQAAMQQLLTGQIRLPGFSGEWEVKLLGDVADLFKGNGLSKGQVSPSGSRPCILYGELFTIYSRVIEYVVSSTDTDDGCISICGDVLMPGSTTTSGIDLAIASALLKDGVALGGDINIIRQRGDDYDPVFLANYLTNIKRKEISELTQGITIHHLYGRDLRTLVLKLPPLAEQTAIAAVLSDMDAELVALEARRDKTRALKQGMMQELLTGRTRLV